MNVGTSDPVKHVQTEIKETPQHERKCSVSKKLKLHVHFFSVAWEITLYVKKTFSLAQQKQVFGHSRVRELPLDVESRT